MPRLEVWLYGTKVGELTGTSWRDFDFIAAPEGLARFGVLSTVLSEAIPFTVRPVPGRAARRRNFFEELLPEDLTRIRLAEQAGVEAGDTLGLLRRYGRDVAGAVEVFDPADPWEPPTPELRPLDSGQVRGLAESFPTVPLGNDPLRGRLSLGGVQLKLALVRHNGHWWQPLGGYPSTHILKQSPERYPTMIFDEEYGCRLATQFGLMEYDVHIESFDDLPMLVIERYDRFLQDGTIQRLHQEDMNQALGASGNQKYQQHGGVVTLQRIARLVAAKGAEERDRLLRMVVFAAAIGNLDLHAKNISLLHFPDSTVRLAPSYDNVPLLCQPTDGELALAVNRVYRLSDLSVTDLAQEARSWGMADQSSRIDDWLTVISSLVDSTDPLPGAAPDLPRIISANIVRLRSR